MNSFKKPFSLLSNNSTTDDEDINDALIIHTSSTSNTTNIFTYECSYTYFVTLSDFCSDDQNLSASDHSSPDIHIRMFLSNDQIRK